MRQGYWEVTHGYLYTYNVKDNKLIVEEGEAITRAGGYSAFEINKTRRISITTNPWKIHNNFIWCPYDERDDLRAISLLVEHEELEIDILMQRAKKHQYKLDYMLDILKTLEKQEKEK